jgi:hypothetical protein
MAKRINLNVNLNDSILEYFRDNEKIEYDDFIYIIQKALSHKSFLKTDIIIAILLFFSGVFWDETIISTVLVFIGIIGFILIPFIVINDRRKGNVYISYVIAGKYKNSFHKLSKSIFALDKSDDLFTAVSEDEHYDTRRHAGATSSFEKEKLHIIDGSANKLHFNIDIPTLWDYNKEFLFLPDSILVISGNSIISIDYEDIELEMSISQLRQSKNIPNDSEVVGKTWKYVNNDGSRDKRFNDNYVVYIFKYIEVYIHSGDDFYLKMSVSNYNIGKDFANALNGYKQEANLKSIYSDLSDLIDYEHDDSDEEE